MQSKSSAVTREIKDRIAIVTLNRPDKRNALSHHIFDGLRAALSDLPSAVRAVILAGNGEHFCAGLDLSEHKLSTPFESVHHSRMGHQLFADIQGCGRPVISAMHGGVIGGGLELVCSTHIRVADDTTFYQLPEGRRGIFVGGGASVRVAKIIGVGRLTELMLTGRRMDVEEGRQIGLSHYRVEAGGAFDKAMELALRVADNAPISNYMMLHALANIEQMPDAAGLFTEALAQALTLTSIDAQTGIDAFLQKREVSF